MSKKIKMTKVESSNVHSIGYDESSDSLYVRFLNGYLYVYYDVPIEVYKAFLNAESKGKFVWRHLRNKYDYERLE